MHVRRIVATCKHGVFPCPQCPIKCVDCGTVGAISALHGVGLFCVGCLDRFRALFRGAAA
jgi:hypothetical protein